MVTIKVLIVDDDMIVCDGLRKVIPWGELEAEVIGSAENGEEAYKLAVLERPDLIISDIKMPVMDGLQLCQKVHDTMVGTNIILLSAHEDFEYARTAMKYGVKNYILKPIDREKINQLIENIKSISEESTIRKNFYATIFDDEIEKNFYEALKNSDSKYFSDYFENQLSSLNISNTQVKELCIKLVNVLFDYFKNLGFSLGAIVISKENVLDELYDKKTRKDIESYTQQLYLDVLQFTSIKKDSHADSIVEYVKKYIYENYSDVNLTVSSVADNLKISPAYLSVIFRQVEHVNISTFISDLRIKRACELLKDPGLKMANICSAVGYQDAHYFAKVFKKVMGATPSEYRNFKLNE